MNKPLVSNANLAVNSLSAPNIVFFNGRLLPPSETFIKAQGEELTRFVPYYVGAHRVSGLPLPPERTLVVNQGGTVGTAEEGIFKLFGSAPRLYQQVTELNPVLVHAHFGICGALAIPLAEYLKVPLITTFYGIDITMKDELARTASLSHRIYFRRLEALKSKTKIIIAISKFIKQKLLEKGFPPDKIIINHIGVDTKIFQPNRVSRRPIVLFVGRLVEKKGCEYLIRAMSKVRAVMPEVELVIIGDGPLRSSLENLAESSLQRYSFLSVQPPEVVKDWMSRAKVFCVPSITATSGDAEGLGVVFAEAQAMGLPVVSTTNGGIPEVVAHEQTGFLAAEKDWERLAHYILQLLGEPILWQRFSSDGRDRVQKLFDQSKLSADLENIYQTVLRKAA